MFLAKLKKLLKKRKKLLFGRRSKNKGLIAKFLSPKYSNKQALIKARIILATAPIPTSSPTRLTLLKDPAIIILRIIARFYIK
jgi:hypothetical protein